MSGDVLALLLIVGGLYVSLVALEKYAEYKIKQEKKEHKCNCGNCKCHNHEDRK